MNNKIRKAAALAIAWALAMPVRAAELPSAAGDRQMAESLVGWMSRVLAVPATPDIDPPLRDAVAAMVKDHLARLRTIVVPAWIAEERAHGGPAVTDLAIARALHNRIVNEMALWRLESPGPAYDAILMRAILRPGACDLPARDSYLGVLMTSFQAVPPADRPTLLAGERQLLARWGTPRTELAAAPARSLADDVTEAIVRLRNGTEAPDAPMAPVLASSVFKDEPGEPWDGLACARNQWGLARALRRGDPPAQALNAWRYASMRTEADWAPRPPADMAPRAANEFPYIAQRDGIGGWVAVRVTPDAQGRFVSAAIAGRHIDVPGVRDNPPVAFDTLFDAASLATAPLRFKPVTPHADGSPLAPVSMKIDWNLQ